jgi:CheY-like chemotaxis protein
MEKCDVLVVDDEADIRTMVAKLLADFGYTVQTASDGSSTLQLMETWSPTLILLDIHLPDGFARLAQRLEQPAGRIPVIAMSGSDEEISEATGIHPVAYLRKPFHLDDLLVLVEQFCRPRRRRN